MELSLSRTHGVHTGGNWLSTKCTSFDVKLSVLQSQLHHSQPMGPRASHLPSLILSGPLSPVP